MAKLKLLRDFITREKYFQQPETGMVFRRIAGGFAWPHKDLPGCVLTLGETRSRQNAIGTGRHDVHKLEEFQSENTAELVDWLALMTDSWMVGNWATPLCDQRVYLLEDANDERRKMRRKPLRYGDPLGWSGKGEGLLPFYHAFAQRRTMSEKTLFLGDGLCAEELAGLRFADDKTSILELPGVAALCFALAEIDMSPGNEWGAAWKNTDALGPADDLGGY